MIGGLGLCNYRLGVDEAAFVEFSTAVELEATEVICGNFREFPRFGINQNRYVRRAETLY